MGWSNDFVEVERRSHLPLIQHVHHSIMQSALNRSLEHKGACIVTCYTIAYEASEALLRPHLPVLRRWYSHPISKERIEILRSRKFLSDAPWIPASLPRYTIIHPNPWPTSVVSKTSKMVYLQSCILSWNNVYLQISPRDPGSKVFCPFRQSSPTLAHPTSVRPIQAIRSSYSWNEP